MADGKKKIQIYSDWWDSFKEMDDETAGKMIKLILGYVNDEHPERDLPKGSLLKLLFIPYQNQLDTALEQWKAKCEKNRENVNKRWNATVSNEIQSNTNVCERIPNNTDKIREDKIREDITTLRSVIEECCVSLSISKSEIEDIMKYIEENKVEVKYPMAFCKAYKNRKQEENSKYPDWLKEYVSTINERAESL